MSEGYYVTSNGDRHEFEIDGDKEIGLQRKDIIKMVIPSDVKHMQCTFNNISSLTILPKSSLKKIAFSYNKVTHIDLPDGVWRVYCQHNPLASLNIPNSLTELYCNLIDGVEEQDKVGLEMNIFQIDYKY